MSNIILVLYYLIKIKTWCVILCSSKYLYFNKYSLYHVIECILEILEQIKREHKIRLSPWFPNKTLS
jgi:hypothetical protein